MKVAFQTKIDLEIGGGIYYDSKGSEANIINPLSQLIKRGEEMAYIIHSKDIYLEKGQPFADAFRLEKNSSKYNDTRDFVIASKQKINLNSLDILVTRGDDIEENPFLDNIYPKIDQSKVYVPIDYWEMKATKDKLDTAVRFGDLNIPQTFYAETQKDLFTHINYLFEEGDRYVVLKDRFGSQGKGVSRIDKEDKNSLENANKFLDKYKKVIIQEFDPSVKKGDIRVVVYDGKYLNAFERRPGDGQWISNISSGGKAHRHTPLEGEVELCEKIASRFPKIKYLGIDLFHSLRLIEVNGYSGAMTSFMNLYNFDLAKKLVDDFYEVKNK